MIYGLTQFGVYIPVFIQYQGRKFIECDIIRSFCEFIQSTELSMCVRMCSFIK